MTGSSASATSPSTWVGIEVLSDSIVPVNKLARTE
jgi:hypothetical protein